MAYTPTEWETGDVITAEKLNKAEEGIADAGPYMIPIVVDGNDLVLQASYDDLVEHKNSIVVGIYDALDGDHPEYDQCMLTSFFESNGTYTAQFLWVPISEPTFDKSIVTFTASTSTDNMVGQ